MIVDLSRFDNISYDPGRGPAMRYLWHIANSLLLQNSLIHFSLLKIIVLRLFGAKINEGVVLKPSVNIKYPWNLEIGDHSWIGEGVWLDSLASISIGRNCCISQGAYLCTGNHDWADSAFALLVKPITVQDGAWVGAKAIVLPGVNIATHSVVTAGSVIHVDTIPYTIYSGNPAVPIKTRVVQELD